MKYLFFLFIVILQFNQSNAQKNLLQFSAGTNFTGSGDSFGFSFFTEYSKKFKKKLIWSASVGGTINDGSFDLFYQYPIGQFRDGSARYTAAGFQATSHIGYSLVDSKSHDLHFRLGGLIRYQSSSIWDAINVLYEPLTGIPFPVIVIENTGPQKTIAAGGSGQLVYNYTLKNNICLGLLVGLQFDTEGDTISQFMFTIGKRF
jgi:hypothetical protein